jgi:hypothetical protein
MIKTLLFIYNIIIQNIEIKKMMQKVEVFGEVPLARFGHTITQGMTPQLLTLNYSIKIKSSALWRSHGRHRQVHNHWRYIHT